MKKININSKENKFDYCKGDYVIEANLNQKQCNIITKILQDANNSGNLDGFEYTIDDNNQIPNLGISYFIESETNNELEIESFFTKNTFYGACAIGFYGKNSLTVYEQLKELINNEFRLQTKSYLII